MSKGVAVSYIIAIVLGIVILALLGFWFNKEGTLFGSIADQETCKAKLIAYCTSWSTSGYDDNKKPGENEDFYAIHKDCEPHKKLLTGGKTGNDIETKCKELLRQTSQPPTAQPRPTSTSPQRPPAR